MAKMTNREKARQSFENTKKFISVLGKGYPLTEEMYNELERCFDFLTSKNKNPNDNFQRFVDFIQYNVPVDTWYDKIVKIHDIRNNGNWKVTYETMCLTYGEEEANRRWQQYKDRQGEVNTFEYKNKTYGMTEQEFKEYNSSRAITLENLINRHGEELGNKKWEDYCQRQRDTCTIDHYLVKWGEIEGRNKYEKWMENFCGKPSKMEKEIIEILENKNPNIQRQKCLTFIDGPNKNMSRFFDIYDDNKMKIIEVNGQIYHADPRYYNENDIVPVKQVTAKESWKYDEGKLELAKSSGYDVFIVWEHDWEYDKQNTIDKLLEWYKE